MLFNKELFKSKYVSLKDRSNVDTLVLIGNGFDLWQGLDTRYSSFEKYYKENLNDILKKLNLKKYYQKNKYGQFILDDKGNKISYTDVELFYGDPFNPCELEHEFWNQFEVALDKVDDQEINYFFGRERVYDIRKCASNAQNILREVFCSWIASIHISEDIARYNFGNNILFINFNYTDTLLKRFGVRAVNEFHIHGEAKDKNSIIFGHATHPELPFEGLMNQGELPRFKGLYFIEQFLYNSDKHIEDNYHKMILFLALHGVNIKDIKKIFVLGLGFGDADLGYIRNLIEDTQGLCNDYFDSLEEDEINFLQQMDLESYVHCNFQYAFRHRERTFGEPDKRFKELEVVDKLIRKYCENDFDKLSCDKQMRVLKAVIYIRFLNEQQERIDRMNREYLRLLRKIERKEFIDIEEAFPVFKNLNEKNNVEWHISYHSENDKTRISNIMEKLLCEKVTMYPSIDECIKCFEK